MTTEVESTDTPVAEIPVLLGLGELVELFPVTKQTVYRWRVPRNGPPMLPAEDLKVSGTPLWRVERILAFAEERKLKPDAKVLRRIQKAQGH